MLFAAWTVLSWAAFAFVVVSVDPFTNGIFAEAFFFGSLFLASTGTLTILGVLGRSRLSNNLPSNHLAPAFRQALLISIAITGILILQRFRFLAWWNLLLLGGILVLVDLIFANKQRTV